jgi:hypothetical protein
MPNRMSGTDDGPSMFLGPALAFGMLNPFLLGALRGSAQANEDFAAVAEEWRDFVGRRLKEDVALVQDLTNIRTADQVMTAYAEFWRKAVEDYGKEMTTMSKLMNGVASKMITTAQSATDEASADMSRSRRAA